MDLISLNCSGNSFSEAAVDMPLEKTINSDAKNLLE